MTLCPSTQQKVVQSLVIGWNRRDVMRCHAAIAWRANWSAVSHRGHSLAQGWYAGKLLSFPRGGCKRLKIIE